MTDFLRYVNTASSGGDGTTNAESGAQAAYATLAAFDAAEAQNLSGGGHTMTVLCTTGSGTAADGGCSWGAGWTTDATHFITVRAHDDDLATRTWDDTKYRQVNTVWVNDVQFGPRVRFQRIQMESTDSYGMQMFYISFPAGTIVFDGCFFKNVTAQDSNSDMYFFTTSEAIYVVNCVFWIKDPGSNTLDKIWGGLFASTDTKKQRIYNNTIYIDGVATPDTDSSGLEVNGAGDIKCYNNIVVLGAGVSGGGLACFKIGGNALEDYNCSSDATAVGDNSRASQTVTFANASTGDFSLDPADEGALGFGVDLSGDGDYPFDWDMEETERTSWDMGAFMSEGGGAVPILIQEYHA